MWSEFKSTCQFSWDHHAFWSQGCDDCNFLLLQHVIQFTTSLVHLWTKYFVQISSSALCTTTKSKDFVGHHLTSVSGPLFQQDKDKPKCRNVRRISPPWLGKRWLNSVTTHLTNQCDHLINVTSNLPRCCRSRHTNIYFCVNRISTVSTLTQVKNVYCLKICSKCTGLLCLYQHEKNQTFIYSSRQVVFLPKSNRRIPVYLMTFYSRYFYMTVAQLQWIVAVS